jgi:hypothetical protein
LGVALVDGSRKPTADKEGRMIAASDWNYLLKAGGLRSPPGVLYYFGRGWVSVRSNKK